jgi:hypothetical protein
VKLTTTKDFQSRHYSFRSTRKARTATSPDAGPAAGGGDETVRYAAPLHPMLFVL